MRPFKAMIDWIDCDWEGRNYVATFATGQTFLALLPLLVACGVAALLMETVGLQKGDWLFFGLFAVGGVLSATISSISLYRWFKGYGRTAYQEDAAARHKRRD